MIREFRITDLEKVMDLWLQGNLQAHDFISGKYWKDHLEQVREMLPEAEVYVYENPVTGALEGFVGLSDNYLAGIFVKEEARSRGIGRALLEHVKIIRPGLTLRVYEKNSRAVQFYLREGFAILSREVEESTGEREYVMALGKF